MGSTLSGILKNVSATTIDAMTFPLAELLEDCVFYPAAGFDGTPVRRLLPQFRSFFYVDWQRSKQQLLQEIEESPFRGFKMIARRAVTASELSTHGWRQSPPQDLDGNLYKQRMLEGIVRDGGTPFCEWMLFDTSNEADPTEADNRFSLLYLRAEGVAAYQACFVQNDLLPAVVSDIRPGCGFGGGYEGFQSALIEVMRRHHRGLPRFLLQWHFDNEGELPEAPWSDEYGPLVSGPWRKDRDPGHSVSLFGLAKNP